MTTLISFIILSIAAIIAYQLIVSYVKYYDKLKAFANIKFRNVKIIIALTTAALVCTTLYVVFLINLSNHYSTPTIVQDTTTISTPSIVLSNIEKTDILIDAIAEVESGDNTSAKSAISSAAGHLQITKACLDEANKIVGEQKYSYADRHSRKEAVEVFKLIQAKYNPKGDIEKAIRLWNGGPGYTTAGTQAYYVKVRRVYNRMIDERLEKIIREYKSLELTDSIQ